MTQAQEVNAELLEACKYAEAYLQGVRNGKIYEESDLVDIIQKAIAKAEEE